LVLGLLGSANTKYSLVLYSHSFIEGRGEEGEMNGGKGGGGRDEWWEGERRER